nr:cysteine-rich repeat secretory protein 38-like [Ipomoea batatas]
MANSKLFCLLLPLLFIAAMQTAMAADPLFHNCSMFGNIPPKFGQESNLRRLLDNLTSTTPINGGFSSASAGQINYIIYGLALCRGDVSTTDCRSCLADARTRIRQLCGNADGAIIWYDNCLIKYAEYNFFGKIDNVNKFYLSNTEPVSNPRVFIPTRNQLLRQLATKAAGQNSFYAAGDANVGPAGSSMKVYGLVQCTRDLSGENCRNCLNGAIAELPQCCGPQQGGRVVGGSCSVRYEIYRFYN